MCLTSCALSSVCLKTANPSDLESFVFASYCMYKERDKAGEFDLDQFRLLGNFGPGNCITRLSNPAPEKIDRFEQCPFQNHTGIQSEWSKQHDCFPAAHRIVVKHRAAPKAASFNSVRSPSAWLSARNFRLIGTRQRENISSSLVQGLKAR